MNDAEVIGRQASRATWLNHAARSGLIAYGVVYLLLAWLAIQLALGDQSEDASPSGAMQELAQQPFGKILVWGDCAGDAPARRVAADRGSLRTSRAEGSTRTWYRLASGARSSSTSHWG